MPVVVLKHIALFAAAVLAVLGSFIFGTVMWGAAGFFTNLAFWVVMAFGTIGIVSYHEDRGTF